MTRADRDTVETSNDRLLNSAWYAPPMSLGVGQPVRQGVDVGDVGAGVAGIG